MVRWGQVSEGDIVIILEEMGGFPHDFSIHAHHSCMDMLLCLGSSEGFMVIHEKDVEAFWGEYGPLVHVDGGSDRLTMTHHYPYGLSGYMRRLARAFAELRR